MEPFQNSVKSRFQIAAVDLDVFGIDMLDGRTEIGIVLGCHLTQVEGRQVAGDVAVSESVYGVAVFVDAAAALDIKVVFAQVTGGLHSFDIAVDESWSFEAIKVLVVLIQFQEIECRDAVAPVVLDRGSSSLDKPLGERCSL